MKLTQETKMAAELDGVANQKSNCGTSEMGGLGFLHDERTGKVAPAIGRADMLR